MFMVKRKAKPPTARSPMKSSSHGGQDRPGLPSGDDVCSRICLKSNKQLGGSQVCNTEIALAQRVVIAKIPCHIHIDHFWSVCSIPCHIKNRSFFGVFAACLDRQGVKSTNLQNKDTLLVIKIQHLHMISH